VPAHELLVLVALEHRADLGLDDVGQVEVGQAGGLLDRLDDREVRDALPVGQAPTPQELRPVADAGHELADQPGLADAGGPEHGEEVARRVRIGRLEGLEELSELALAADHRRVQAAGDRPDHLAHAEQAEGADGLRLALRLERRGLLGLDRIADQAVGRLADQDLAGSRALLEPGRDVDGVAGNERGVGRGAAGHDLAGVHADPHLDRDAAVAFELLVQRGELLAHVRRGADRPQGVVFVQLRDAEYGHHRVPDVLLDRAAVALDRRAHRLEVAGLHVAEGLGVQPLAHRGRARDVAEDHRHGLAHLAPGQGGRLLESVPAVPAEPLPGRVRFAA
jgi:hypothetical protein